MKSERWKGIAVFLAFAGIILAGSFGVSARRDESVDAESYITCVTKEEENVDGRKIAITFDDGPHPYYTEQLLDGLKEREAKASFFVMGKQAEAYPELIVRMQEEGD